MQEVSGHYKQMIGIDILFQLLLDELHFLVLLLDKRQKSQINRLEE